MNRFILGEKFIHLENIPEIILYECKFCPEFYSDDLFARYGIQFPASLKNSVVKRKSEFFSGRYACKKTLEHMDITDHNVGIGKHRNPIWPNGIKGSITHTNTSALCAASDEVEVESIGIDREHWLSQKSADNLKLHIISQSEESYLMGLGLSLNRLLTIIFSAKESVFKALYPFVEHYFDFHATSIVSISFFTNQGEFVFKLHAPIFENYTGDYIEGTFYIDDEYVTTILVLTHSKLKIPA